SMPAMQWPATAADWGVAEPDVDFTENESEYAIRAALPGISPEDIDLQAMDDTIRLTAVTRTESQQPQQTQQGGNGNQSHTGAANASGGQNQQGQTTQHRQSQFSRVSRFEFAYTLPEEIKPNEVSANFKNGILELKLPKARPNSQQARTVRVPIQSAGQNARIASGTASSGAQAGGGQSQGATGVGATSEHQAGGRTGDGTSGKKSSEKAGQTGAATATANSK
ncbi:MAG TPA: Hsp20 family protein, partial [Chthonomonadaceae bacterium]|nr:Hsp20 family protein [Chthonomonadaceae bacterium]